MPQTISFDTSARPIDLQGQHLEANLDAADLMYLDTPSGDRKKPTRVRGVSID